MGQISNLALWNEVRTPDPKYTKGFNRGGGFKGTATNATWLAMRATEMFGLIGIGWGVNVVDEKFQPGAGTDIIHIVRIKLWYLRDGQRGEVEAFGQTTFVGKNKNGPFTDEEAPKKSLTDATTKALAQLGFAADIHMGLFDDVKYVNDADAKWAEREAANERGNGNDNRQQGSNDNGQDHGGDDAGPEVSSEEEKQIEAEISEALKAFKMPEDGDKKAAIAQITDYMTSAAVKDMRARLGKEAYKRVRDLGTQRLKEFGFQPAKKQAAAAG